MTSSLGYEQPTRIIYGNVGWTEDGKSMAIMGGSRDAAGNYNFSVEYGTTGLYIVKFAVSFSGVPAVVLTQIYHGSSSADLSTVSLPQSKLPVYPGVFGDQWGSSLDNAVLIGISPTEFKLITGGLTKKANRMFGFMAVGQQEPSS